MGKEQPRNKSKRLTEPRLQLPPRMPYASCTGYGMRSREIDSQKASSTTDVMFIHMPRTGGTSLEQCTKFELDDKYAWGAENSQLRVASPLSEKLKSCVGQHLPPGATNFYSGKETFC